MNLEALRCAVQSTFGLYSLFCLPTLLKPYIGGVLPLLAALALTTLGVLGYIVIMASVLTSKINDPNAAGGSVFNTTGNSTSSPRMLLH